MSFGEVLQELILVSKTKKTALASYLGYDLSYISRWTSGAKLPSLSNNETLFDSIVQCLTETEASQNALIAHSGLPADTEVEMLREQLRLRLTQAYRESVAHKNPAASEPDSLSNNSLLIQAYTRPKAVNQFLIDEIAKAAGKSGGGPIEIALMPTVENLEIGATQNYWTTVLEAIPPQARIHISFIIPTDADSYAGVVYRALLTLFLGLPERIEVDLYKRSSDVAHGFNIVYVKGTVCQAMYYDSILKHSNILLIRDPRILDEYEMAINQLIWDQKTLLTWYKFSELDRQYFLIDLFAQPNLRSIHTSLPLFALDAQDREWLFTEAGADDHSARVYSLYGKSLRGWEFVIYKSALLDFISNGAISVTGSSQVVPKERRKQMLELMLENTRTRNWKMRILEDDNNVLPQSDFNAAVFLSENAVLGLPAHKHDRNAMMCIGTDAELIASFSRFFDEIWNLPSITLLNPEASESYLEICLSMLDNDND